MTPKIINLHSRAQVLDAQGQHEAAQCIRVLIEIELKKEGAVV